MVLSKLRASVDGKLPLLGQAYRTIRDIGVSQWSRPTPHGFSLAGAPEMTRASFDKEQSSTFLEQLERCDVVLDIGANVGFYSCLAASRGKKTLAFEPSPRNLKYLYSNLWANNFHDVELFPLGLGCRPGLAQIFGFGGISSFVRGWAQARSSRFFIVPISSLDIMVGARFAGSRILVKMDVEGFELQVLEGAHQFLQTTPRPVWMVEIMLSNPLIPGGCNPNFRRTFELFWNYGYQSQRLDQSHALVTQADIARWSEEQSVPGGTVNFLFS